MRMSQLETKSLKTKTPTNLKLYKMIKTFVVSYKKGK